LGCYPLNLAARFGEERLPVWDALRSCARELLLPRETNGTRLPRFYLAEKHSVYIPQQTRVKQELRLLWSWALQFVASLIAAFIIDDNKLPVVQTIYTIDTQLQFQSDNFKFLFLFEMLDSERMCPLSLALKPQANSSYQAFKFGLFC
jgi:hypothetical protein